MNYSARVPTGQGPGDPSQTTSAPISAPTCNDRDVINNNPDMNNNTVLSFLAQQIQLLKQDFNCQIGALKTNMLVNSNQQENLPEETPVQQQINLPPQNLPFPVPMVSNVNPYMHPQQHHPQQIQPPWHLSQALPPQNNAAQAS